MTAQFNQRLFIGAIVDTCNGTVQYQERKEQEFHEKLPEASYNSTAVQICRWSSYRSDRIRRQYDCRSLSIFEPRVILHRLMPSFVAISR